MALVAAIWLYVAPHKVPVQPRPTQNYNTRLQAVLLLVPSALWLSTARMTRQRVLACQAGRPGDQGSAGLYDMSMAVFVLCSAMLEMERAFWGTGRNSQVTVVMIVSSASATFLYKWRHLYV